MRDPLSSAFLRVLFSAVLVLTGALSVPVAHSQLATAVGAQSSEVAGPEAEPRRVDDLGALERRALDAAIEETGLAPDAFDVNAVSATDSVCVIHTVQQRIVEPEDTLPLILNRLHRTTRDRAVRAAVAALEAAEYSELVRADAERELRSPTLFAVALVVPVPSTEAGCVDILVVTRDAWSLTANVAPEVNGSVLSSLYLGVTEANLFGTTQQLTVSATLTPLSWQVGPTFYSRRIGRSRLQLSASARLHVDREAGRGVEGSSSSLQLGRPLFSSTEKWSWSVALSHDVTMQRVRVGRAVRRFESTVLDPLSDDPSAVVLVDERWRQRVYSASSSVTRSFGLRYKNDVTPSFRATSVTLESRPYADVPQAAVDEFEAAVLPRGGAEVGPGLRWEFYENRHFRLRNVQTYGVAEEFRRGPYFSPAFAWAESALGSRERSFSPAASALWRQPFWGGYGAASLGTSGRFADGGWTDHTVTGALRWVSSDALFGRLLVRAATTVRLLNEGNRRSFIGGRTSLRGYAEGFEFGDHVARTNIEWRSRSFAIGRWRFGGALFHDGAAAWS
ncbi:MAG: hypothetical protein ACI81R_003232, partial [Bradymonadia bacterium]